ncbi:ribosomal protein S16 domain-containing protein [Scleroderma yunnanense]
MTVRLRMAVHGTKGNRIFHLVAIDHRRRRDGKPMELLGVYDPSPKFDKLGEQSYKTMKWSVDRIKYWLGVGAVPSKPVVRFLEWGGVIPPDSRYHPKPWSTSTPDSSSSVPEPSDPPPTTTSPPQPMQ